MTLTVNLQNTSYDIVVERGILKQADRYLNLQRRVLIVTDSGVPESYAQTVAALAQEPTIVTIEQGEESKSLATYETLLKTLLEQNFTRQDCVVAVGGGVVGDLAGFTAASYMRGVDFYNIPTTLLAQVDSSIGGKTAINFGGIKNIVGAFYQPKCVLIDPDLLKTLPQRQLSNGLAEALKMSLTFDEDLFSLFEKENIESALNDIIVRSLMIKKDVVEKDEKESGLRRVLNFGHTVGHGIESENARHGLYHGECVALGMIPMCSDAIKAHLLPILEKLSLPTKADFDPEKALSAMLHDKKADGTAVTVVTVDKIGTFTLKQYDKDALLRCLDCLLS
ncbi:MAG: 3-dehydroquinate synthase [Clostridia bacterium]|nr:3-dehydroquinate synthase [Clostridia bacterium]